MVRKAVLQELRPFLNQVFRMGNGPYWPSVLDFIDLHTPLEDKVTGESARKHLHAVLFNGTKAYQVRVLAAYLLQDVFSESIDLPPEG
jgi:hypothetical protein